MRIYFDHQLCLLFSNIYGNQTVKRGTTLCTVKLFIQLMYNKNGLKSGLFLSGVGVEGAIFHGFLNDGSP